MTALAPTPGTLREQLIELLSRQAALFNEAPLHVTLLAWLAMGPSSTNDHTAGEQASGALRARVIDQYRQPFDTVLGSQQARAELDDFDLELGLCQVVGPLAFARMTGFRNISHDDCTKIVDDFLAAHRRIDKPLAPGKPAT